MNKLHPAGPNPLLTEGEIAAEKRADSPLQHMTQVFGTIIDRSQSRCIAEDMEAERAEAAKRDAMDFMSKAIDKLNEAYRLTDDRTVLGVMNGLTDLQSDLNVALGAFPAGSSER